MAPSAQDSAIAFFYWELREERAETEGRYRSPDTAPMKATDKADGTPNGRVRFSDVRIQGGFYVTGVIMSWTAPMGLRSIKY